MQKLKFPNLNDIKDDFFIQYVNNEQRTEKEHTHQFFQIFFLVQGKLVHNINGVSAEMSLGEMTIIPPNVKHCISLTDNPVYYSFSFSLSVLGEVCKNNQSSIEFLTNISKSTTLYPKTILSGQDVLLCKNIFENIYKELSCREIAYKEAVCSYLILLLTQFVRKYFLVKDFSQKTFDFTNEQMILRCIDYINEHFCEDLRLKEVAKLFAVSVSTFCTCFKKITGKTFNLYVMDKRINYANTLIKKGYKLSAVCDMCGFNDYSTFVRNYKKITGVSPYKFLGDK